LLSFGVGNFRESIKFSDWVLAFLSALNITVSLKSASALCVELILSESIMVKMRYLLSLFCVAVVVVITPFAFAQDNTSVSAPDAAPQQEITPQKSENDKRYYRYLTLPNQLRVLLISDPGTEKSAAALSVAVGANQNPPEREGLAHFLEHMLFLGTEKYPEAGEYQSFIAKNGGTYNAYTAAENTNYFFDIENSKLEPALDRFAQFFIAPLFTAEYVDRERNAVHSEYVAKLKDDGRKEWDVYRELMNAANPSALFTVGNHTTLADRDDSTIRTELIAFYERYYSAHLMSLVVVGREDVDALESLVKNRFSQVPQRQVNLPETYPALFPQDSLPAYVEIKPEKEQRQLAFNFPIDNPDNLYAYKTYEYIGHLLGYEGKGSLLALLKRLGWAESLYAGVGMKNRQQALFQIGIELTPEGVIAKDQIVSLVFHSIEQIKTRGLNQWRYEELQELADMEFRFLEKEPPASMVSRLATLMPIYSPKDLLRGDYLYKSYNEKYLSKSLSYFRPDNLLLVLSDPSIQPYRVSHYYSAPYSVRAGVPAISDLKPAIKAELFLPEPNVFIPRRLTVKSSSLLEEASVANDIKPALIVDNPAMRTWFLQDKQFNQPKAVIDLRIKSPLVSASAQGAANAQLLAALLMDQLTDVSYPASLAGLTSTITANSRGLDIQISGYSGRQSLLLNKVVAAIRTSKFDAERYTNIKNDLLRRLKNEKKNLPFQVLAKQIPVLHYDPYWSSTELIAALESLQLEQFQRFTGRVLIDAKIDALFYGNYFKAEALKLSTLIEHELLNRQTERELPLAKALLLPKNATKPWLYHESIDHSDHVVELFIHSPSASITDTAHMQLIRQIIQPDFFNELRTEKQLGYIVAAIPMPLRTVDATVFVVQSPVATESTLVAEIDQFLTAEENKLTEHFEQHQQSLIKKLTEPPRSLMDQADRYWDSVVMGDYDFTRRTALASAVKAITPKALKAYYREQFLPKNRRLWLVSGDVDHMDDYHHVKNVQDYKKQLDPIVLP